MEAARVGTDEMALAAGATRGTCLLRPRAGARLVLHARIHRVHAFLEKGTATHVTAHGSPARARTEQLTNTTSCGRASARDCVSSHVACGTKKTHSTRSFSDPYIGTCPPQRNTCTVQSQSNSRRQFPGHDGHRHRAARLFGSERPSAERS